MRLHFVAVSAGPQGHAGTAHAAQALPLAQPVLDAGPGQPPIIARASWAQGHAPPSHVPLYGTVKLAFVHHSETPNGYSAADVPSILRSIFVYHRYVRGYFDIAYNFAIDEFGRIWEARAGGVDLPVIGAHAGGYNQESTGMVVLGSFTDVVPSAAAIGALEQLLAWKLSLHGIPALGRVTVEVAPDAAFYTPFRPGAHVSLPRVAGHRDGDETSCPGNAFYARLPSIRPRAAALAGTPARATITAPAAPASAGTAVTVTGLLTDLGTGGPLAGAPIELQTIGPHTEQTIATLTTAADGSWSNTFTPTENTLLRALHRAAPAAVSDVTLIAVEPTLTLSVVSSAPLAVSGTVSAGHSPRQGHGLQGRAWAPAPDREQASRCRRRSVPCPAQNRGSGQLCRDRADGRERPVRGGQRPAGIGDDLAEQLRRADQHPQLAGRADLAVQECAPRLDPPGGDVDPIRKAAVEGQVRVQGASR